MVKGKAYTDCERCLIAAAYVRMAIAQLNGEKLVKIELIRDLMKKTDRTRGAIEASFMNISHHCKNDGYISTLPDGYVKGYKPAPNAAKVWRYFIVEEVNANAAKLGLI